MQKCLVCLVAFPWDLALDRENNLYVIDGWAVRKIDTHAMVSTLAGSPDQAGSTDGTGSAARFSGLSSVAVSPAGNVYVADNELKNIRKITPAVSSKRFVILPDELCSVTRFRLQLTTKNKFM